MILIKFWKKLNFFNNFILILAKKTVNLMFFKAKILKKIEKNSKIDIFKAILSWKNWNFKILTKFQVFSPILTKLTHNLAKISIFLTWKKKPVFQDKQHFYWIQGYLQAKTAEKVKKMRFLQFWLKFEVDYWKLNFAILEKLKKIQFWHF